MLDMERVRRRRQHGGCQRAVLHGNTQFRALSGIAQVKGELQLAAIHRNALPRHHGGRFLEGLDPAESYAVLERHAPGAIRRYRSESELRMLVGTGVSAAAIWRMREALDEAGYERVRLVVSSGFGVTKCRVMADAAAPIDIVGTGSFIPDAWAETYATADIVAYDGVPMVKVGREFLLRRNGERQKKAESL